MTQSYDELNSKTRLSLSLDSTVHIVQVSIPDDGPCTLRLLCPACHMTVCNVRLENGDAVSIHISRSRRQEEHLSPTCLSDLRQKRRKKSPLSDAILSLSIGAKSLTEECSLKFWHPAQIVH